MKPKTSFVISMIIFGSMGIVVKNINLSSLEISLLMGIIGSLFLVGVGFATKIKISIKDIKANALLLILSGVSVGINWISLFQGYKYTTVSNATLVYYFAPIFVIILAPIVLKEKITLTKIICSFTAMLGLFLIINVGGGNDNGSYNHLLGIGYALLGAVVYAIVILINKHIKKLGGFETTLIQLVVATIVLLPVVLLQSNLNMLNMGIKSWSNMLLLGVVHTGIAYLLYFKSMKEISAQSVAILSYIDPISAVIMAILFLGEDMTIVKVIGGILILGSTYFAESVNVRIPFKNNKENSECSEGS